MDPTQSAIESTLHLPYDLSPASVITAAVVCSLGILYFCIFGKRVATNASWYALTEDALKNPSKAREQWLTKPWELLSGGLKKMKRAIAVTSPTGPLVFLPNSFAHEIRNMKELNFAEGFVTDFMGGYRGLTPISMLTNQEIVQEVTRLNLTRSLDSITDDLTSEIQTAIIDMLGNILPDWKSIDLKSFMYRVVARASTRIFLGPEVSNNEEYLDIAVSYTTNCVMAIQKLRTIHPLWRPIVQWWMPELRVCQQQVAKVREIINPLAQQRLRRKANGETSQKNADMISWIDDKAKAKGVKANFADTQLLLAIAAIHTTTETISNLMLDLLENEEWIPLIREEIVSVLSTNGWKKTSLASMTLLDSAMKESQRLGRLTDLALQRKAISDVTLSDGTFIPKGYKVALEPRFEDPTIYPNPHKFEADRFLKLRDTDRSKWHFVTGSPEHPAFGYGKHTCPGRFFASNEIKIIMAHLLVKYDWKFTEEGRFPTMCTGPDYSVDPRQKVMVKTRVEEINLAAL